MGKGFLTRVDLASSVPSLGLIYHMYGRMKHVGQFADKHSFSIRT
jgi:hypothetical protein